MKAAGKVSSVLIIDADRAAREQFAASLNSAGFHTSTTDNADAGILLARNLRPQIILCDPGAQHMSAGECYRALREIESLQPFHFIVLAANNTQPHTLEIFAAGVDEVLPKTIAAPQLIARLKAVQRTLAHENTLQRRIQVITRLTSRLRARNEKLHALATRDFLTGLFNRREAISRLRTEIAASRRYNQPFTCALIDIDQFKTVNDTAGHLVGDCAIRHVAHSLLRFVRDCDQVYRLGGDEFLVLFPNTNSTGAEISMERFRTLITESPIEHQGWAVDLSVSIGIADLVHRIGTPEDLLERADAALFAAKHAGRNAVRAAATCLPPLAGLAN